MTARALHYVFKIANRKASYDFFIGTLGMKVKTNRKTTFQVLRHEEFQQGCEAECNGPYNGCWSKTMVGYGSEDSHFVLELTYNYEIGSYELGNDFQEILIESDAVYSRVGVLGVPTSSGALLLKDPDGHCFLVQEGNAQFPITRVAITTSNLDASVQFWNGLLEMSLVSRNDFGATLRYADGQCALQLRALGPVHRGTGYGRIAFSYADDQLKGLEERVEKAGGKILKRLVTLHTPGKASVQDAHEICFVGDAAFRELSRKNETAEANLLKAIQEDWSDQWFKNGKKTATD